MLRLRSFSATLLVLVSVLTLVPSRATAADLRSYHNSLEARYSRAHSLGDTYQFDPRDGWQSVNISNLAYKYRRQDPIILGEEAGNEAGELAKRSSKKSKSKSHSKSKTHSGSKPKATPQSKSKSKNKAKSSKSTESTTQSVSKSVSSLGKIIDSIKGVGNSEPVTITWYRNFCAP
jgi:hypothetical protein